MIIQHLVSHNQEWRLKNKKERNKKRENYKAIEIMWIALGLTTFPCGSKTSPNTKFHSFTDGKIPSVCD
jgi:hypothetical protein